MSGGMGTSFEYSILITVMSLISFALFTIHLWRAVRVYQHHHDDRAAVALVKALGLLIISGGMVISGVGLLVNDALFAISGLSISRGALIMVAATLVLADVKRGSEYPNVYSSHPNGAPHPSGASTVTNETTYGIEPDPGTDKEYARQDHTHGSPDEPERSKA